MADQPRSHRIYTENIYKILRSSPQTQLLKTQKVPLCFITNSMQNGCAAPLALRLCRERFLYSLVLYTICGNILTLILRNNYGEQQQTTIKMVKMNSIAAKMFIHILLYCKYVHTNICLYMARCLPTRILFQPHTYAHIAHSHIAVIWWDFLLTFSYTCFSCLLENVHSPCLPHGMAYVVAMSFLYI